MPLPRWLARFNFRVTNPLLSPMASRLPGMGIVIHTGRKTHSRYRTPVMVFRRGDRFLIALTYGSGSQWVRNVLAQGGCELETQGHTVRLSDPHLLHDEEGRAVPALHRHILKLLDVADFLELTAAG